MNYKLEACLSYSFVNYKFDFLKDLVHGPLPERFEPRIKRNTHPHPSLTSTGLTFSLLLGHPIASQSQLIICACVVTLLQSTFFFLFFFLCSLVEQTSPNEHFGLVNCLFETIV